MTCPESRFVQHLLTYTLAVVHELDRWVEPKIGTIPHNTFSLIPSTIGNTMVSGILITWLDIYIVTASCLALVVFRFVADRHQSPKNGPFPPGPEPRWFIGNALDIAFKDASRVYYAMSKEYNSKRRLVHNCYEC